MCQDWRSSAIPSPRSSPRVSSSSPSRSCPAVSWTGARSPSRILYEVHDPSAYLTPDVILDITDVEVMPVGPDRVRVVGARGKPRPETLKATAFLASGMLGEAEISYAGPNALARAQLAAEIVTTRMAKRMPELKIRVDLVGRASLFGTLAPACSTDADATAEVRLRFAAQHAEREPLELLLDEVEALYCSGPSRRAGVRRYLTPRLASASCLIERERSSRASHS